MAKQEHILDDNLDENLQEEFVLIATRGTIYEERIKATLLIAPFIAFCTFVGIKIWSKFAPKVFQLFKEIPFLELFEWQLWENKIGIFIGGIVLILIALILTYYLLALWVSQKIVIVSPHQILQCYKPFPVARANVRIFTSDITDFEITPCYNSKGELADYYVCMSGREKEDRYVIITADLSKTSEDIEGLKQKLEQLLGRKAIMKARKAYG